jgi:hypothetical protein
MLTGLSIQDLWKMLQAETTEISPNPDQYNIFKERRNHNGW